MDAPLWKLLADAASCPITISIGGEPVEARSFADWSSLNAVESTLIIAEPKFEGGACVIENRAEVAGKVVLIQRALVPSGEHKGAAPTARRRPGVPCHVR